MRGSAGLYVTTNGTTSLETLGLVCNALVREILTARRNCSSRKLLVLLLLLLLLLLYYYFFFYDNIQLFLELNGMAFLVW